jgi:hypothetical protein
MRCGTPRRSKQNQSFDEEIGKIPEQLRNFFNNPNIAPSRDARAVKVVMSSVKIRF